MATLPRHTMLPVLLAAAVALGSWWLSLDGPAAPLAAAPAPAGPADLASPFGSGAPVLGADAAPPPMPAASVAQALAAGPVVDASLPTISLEELQQLRETLRQGGEPDAEFTRVADFMLYADALQRFRQLRQQGGGVAEQQALARLLDQGLADRLQRREMGGAEAVLVKTAVLEVLQPDPAQRQQQLKAWQQDQARQAAASAPAPDAREQAYRRDEAAALAQWQALPAAQRDPRALEAELEALRRKAFAGPRP